MYANALALLPHDLAFQVLVEDGMAFVAAAAAAAMTAPSATSGAATRIPHNSQEGGSKSTVITAAAAAAVPEALPVANDADDADTEKLPPPPVSADVRSAKLASGLGAEASETGATAASEIRWGGVFGPPYSAIFVDVDNKDTSVGMSCPPAAFLEKTFLTNLKVLLQGAGVASARGVGVGGGATSGEGPPGVLAINVAARSKQLFSGAVGAVCGAFPGGEVIVFWLC